MRLPPSALSNSAGRFAEGPLWLAPPSGETDHMSIKDILGL